MVVAVVITIFDSKDRKRLYINVESNKKNVETAATESLSALQQKSTIYANRRN